MPSVIRLVCLANSRKLQGRCIAGREWDGAEAGAWVRPVSTREGGDVSEYERQYQDGSDPRVLDIIEVPVLRAQPEAHQTENWVLNPKYYWQKVGLLSPSRLPAVTDPVAPLWVDGHRTYTGRNDRVPMEDLSRATTSLRLLRADSLRLRVFAPSEAFGNSKRRVQGEFRHAGREYRLWVTDPDMERTYLANPDGTYDVGPQYLTVSLGEPYKGACYKLIAAVIPASGK